MKKKVLTQSLLSDSLLQKQIKLEEDARSQGIARYWRQAQQAIDRGEAAALRPVQRLLAYWLPNMIETIRAEQRAIRAGKAAPNRAMYGPTLLMLEPENIATVALSEGVSVLVANPAGLRMTGLGYCVGRAIVSEIHVSKLKELSRKLKKDSEDRPDADDQNLWRLVLASAKNTNPKIVNKVAKKYLEDPCLQRVLIHYVGLYLVNELFNQCVLPNADGTYSPAFKVAGKSINKKKTAWIELHQSALDAIDEAHQLRMGLRPRYQPMIVQPYPWQPGKSGTLKDGVQGGYITIRTPLVSKPYVSQKEAFLNAEMPRFLSGLHKVSSTPWRVNTSILEVVKYFWERGGNMLGIPSREMRPKPPTPNDIDTNSKAKSQYKQEARKWYDEEVQHRSDRTAFLNRVGVADQYTNKTIYFPHQADFRTRAYPIPPHLNHQGPDICRGMLEFADGYQPGVDGEKWLMIHTANCYGIDKVTFAERLQWVSDNQRDIEKCGKDPLDTDFWHDADRGQKPWQFLAACKALTNREHGARMPVQIDGTCNGIQHYAALTLDSETASMVNMTGNDKPADLYTKVTLSVRASVAEHPLLSQYLYLIGRSLIKPPVMTSTYGVTIEGIKRQLQTELENDLNSDEAYKVAHALSGIVASAISKLCPKAWEAMRWLKGIAKIVTSAGHLLCWNTPLRFPVVQHYAKPRSLRARFRTRGFVIDYEHNNPIVSVSKQLNGFAPNFIHSLDATHMYMVAEQLGKPFAAAHDCFIAHAAHATKLNFVARSSMIELYSVDRMQELHGSLTDRYRIELPSPPERGDYDLSLLLTSPYAFH